MLLYIWRLDNVDNFMSMSYFCARKPWRDAFSPAALQWSFQDFCNRELMVQCLLCKCALMESVLLVVKTSGRSPGPSPSAFSLGEMRIAAIRRGEIQSPLFAKACPSCNYLKAHTRIFAHTLCKDVTGPLIMPWSFEVKFLLSVAALHDVTLSSSLQSWWRFPFGPNKRFRSCFEWSAHCCHVK